MPQRDRRPTDREDACSQRRSRAALWLRAALCLPALAAAGCNAKESTVRARAANDLGCSDLEVQPLAGSAYQVRGCGQTATYACTQEAPRNPDATGWDAVLSSDGDIVCVREGEVKREGGEPQPSGGIAAAGVAGSGGPCPAGSHWEGGRCVGDMVVSCPAGHRFEVGVGCVPGAPESAGAAPAARSCPARMAFVPGGSFTDDQGKPASAGDLCVDATEVRAGEYSHCVSRRACTDEGLACDGGPASTFVGNDRWNHPINCVSWGQAAVYCKAQGKRLPTEQEWLWVARGGGAGTQHPWGDEAPGDRVCWSGVAKREATCVAGEPAGDATPQRVLGLAGNVAEWTSSARGGASTRRVVRGGHFASPEAARGTLLAGNEAEATARAAGVGFRCVTRAR
jgi:hypothetical protein